MLPRKYLSKCLTCVIAVLILLSLPAQSVGQSFYKKMADTLYDQGEQQYQQNQQDRFLAAIESWQHALKLYQDISALRMQGHTLFRLGDAYRSLGKYEKAIDHYQQSIAIARKFSDLSLVESNALIHLGYVYLKLGKYQESIQHSERGLETAKKIEGNLRRGEAVALYNLGEAYRSLSEYEKAINHYQQSIAIARNFPDLSLIESDALMYMGYVYWLIGEYKESIRHSEQALETARNKDYFLEEAVALNNLGSAYKSICQYDRALNYHKQSLDLAKTIEERKSEASALGNLGNLYHALNKPLEALESHEQNLDIARELGDRLEEANALGNIGSAYHALANYQKAEKYHQQRLELAQEIGDRQGKARAIGDLGSVYYRYGQYTKAIKNHQKHLEVTANLKDRQGQVSALTNLGHDYNAVGQPIEAMKHLQQARGIAREIGDCRTESNSLNGLGLSLQDLGSYQEAIQYFEQSLKLAQKHRDERGKGHVVGNLGSTYLEWGIRDKKPEYFRKAIEYYAQKLEIVRKNKDFRSEGAVLTNMGIARTKLGNYEAAADSLRQARRIFQKIGDRHAYGQAVAGTALLQQQQGNIDRAIALYREAIEIKENIRSQLMIGAFKSSFEERQVDIYAQIIELLWDRGDKQEAFNYVERARAKTFLDRLADGKIDFRSQADTKLLEREQTLKVEKIAQRNELIALKNRDEDDEAIAQVQQELTDIETKYTNLLTQIELQHPELASLVSLQPRQLLSLAQIQQQLGKDTTLVEYFVTERTFAFIITHDSFEAIELNAAQSQFKEALEKFRRFSDIKRTPHPDALLKFYEWLIDPLQGQLSSAKANLMIVPHGILHYLPFAALTDGERYLIDTYNVSTLPSANVLEFLSNEQSAKEPNSAFEAFLAKLNNWWNFLKGDRLLKNEILVLGNPVTPMPKLQSAAKEAETIARLYKTQAFLEGEATESILRAKAEESAIVHLAAHGEYNNRNPLFSTIYLAKDEQDRHDGLLEVHEVYGLNLARANLVVLSACETNIGDLSKGDELVGLNRAFIYAQAPTVIASLWSVDDESTRLLMEQFYSYLRQGTSKAKALRQAQKVVRETYPHPFFWAAFSLTGDGGI